MEVSRIFFFCTIVTAALVSSFGAGLYSGYYKNSAFELVKYAKDTVKESIAAVRETSFITPVNFLQPVRGEGEGVTVNTRPDDGSLILLSGFFEDSNELRLIRRNGSIVMRWPVSFKALFPKPDHLAAPPATDWNVDLHGALIEPDGSIVFNFELNGLAKLDRCGRTLWTLGHMTHHSVEWAEGGGYWVAGRQRIETGNSKFRPYSPPYNEDLILKVSETGQILSRISVPALLYENGLEAVLTATGESFWADFQWDEELVHLNKIGELGSDLADNFPSFEAGDLVLSLRQLNLVMVVDPDTREIKWHQTGPWLRQHDPEFNRDGSLTIFNNNSYRMGLSENGWSDPAAPRTTNILRIDPLSRETRVAFGEKPGQEMLSLIRGKHDVTEDGGFFITEFEAGRVIESDAAGNIVWEYINRYSGDYVAEISEARIYPAGYFNVADWSCPSQQN